MRSCVGGASGAPRKGTDHTIFNHNDDVELGTLDREQTGRRREARSESEENIIDCGADNGGIVKTVMVDVR